uniref:Protein kinase domain-containing protein n=1 Tax=Xenopus tropicalis TaxID=8364 RepID=A0A1B8XXM4_XENTR
MTLFPPRDLKLENVLLDSRGHAKIADFGLAAHMINGKAKGCVGTRGYVAPEVLCRDKYDYTVDYYSLGVILFRMATGLKLEQEPTPESKAQIHSMSPELRDFILKLVCDNPEERMRFVCSIKDHPFLGPIDWEALENRKLKPPYIMPQPKKLGESVPYGTLMQSKGEKIPLTTSQQELFRGIPFVRNCNT